MGGHCGGHWEGTVEATGRALGGHCQHQSVCLGAISSGSPSGGMYGETSRNELVAGPNWATISEVGELPWRRPHMHYTISNAQPWSKLNFRWMLVAVPFSPLPFKVV